MKRFRLLTAALGSLFLCAGSVFAATSVTMDGPMTDGNAAIGQAGNKNFALNMDDHNIDVLSVQTTYSSGSYTNPGFTDGRASTMSITVSAFASLANSTATASVTISSNAGLAGQSLFIAGTNIPFAVGTVSSMTACDMASKIAAQTIFLSTCSVGTAAGVIYATAPVFGASFNQYSMQSTSITAISSAAFSGGRDNGVFTINGISVSAETDYKAVTSNAQTASNIATAFGVKASSLIVTSQAIGAVVTSTSNLVGVAYAITSSSQAAAQISPFTSSSVVTGVATGTMYGGVASSFTINASTIKIPAHGLPTGIGVYVSSAGNSALSYTQVGGAAGSLALNTTYYVISVDANDIQLSLTSTGAVAGVPLVWTSSQVKTTADSYTFTVPAITGTPTIGFWASNDGNLYTQIGSTYTVAGYVFPSTATFNDIGTYDYKWFQARVVGPTGGAMPLSIYVHGEKR